jgi:hypothetical protein
MHTVSTYFIDIILVSISGLIHHTRVDECIIDDTGLAASAQSSIEITSTKNKYFSPYEILLFDNMQNMLQFFLELLQIAGGNLNISKCACFTVFQIWIGGCASRLKMQDYHLLVTITHPHKDEIKNIDKKDPNQSHRSLGWMMTTDGKYTAQFIVLKRKAKLFTGAILQSQMQRYGATNAYNCYYLDSVGYTLTATRISLDQCKTIQSPVLCTTLKKRPSAAMWSAQLCLAPRDSEVCL